MNTQKDDPRVIRTRKLLIESFLSLISKKDFNDITVRDITETATVNRATFYAHFADKYELLDFLMTDIFMQTLQLRLHILDEFNEETITKIFLAMCDFHKELSSQCKIGYESLSSILEKNIKEELQKIIYNIISIENPKSDQLTIIATMLSWSIYGAAYTWNTNGRKNSAEELVSEIMPVIMNGISYLKR